MIPLNAKNQIKYTADVVTTCEQEKRRRTMNEIASEEANFRNSNLNFERLKKCGDPTKKSLKRV